jgi:hypothetical protein
VIHVICDRIIDHGDLLHRVGEMSFSHRTGRGDGAKHPGSPDRGDEGWSPEPRNSYWPPHADGKDPEDVIRFKSHDFRWPLPRLAPHQRVIIALSVQILRRGVTRCSDAPVDVFEVRLALRCLLPPLPGGMAARALLGCCQTGERRRGRRE